MCRIDGQRGHDRKNPLHEPGVEPGLVGVRQRLGAAQRDPGLAAASVSKSPRMRCWSASSNSARCLMSVNCCAAVRPSAEVPGGARLCLPDQRGDAHRVEFIEVGGADRQEAQPLQQRVARVLGFLQNAVVEIQPGQLAVDEAVRAGAGRTAGSRLAVGLRPAQCSSLCRRTSRARVPTRSISSAASAFSTIGAVLRELVAILQEAMRLRTRGHPLTVETSRDFRNRKIVRFSTRAASCRVIAIPDARLSRSSRATASRSAAGERGRRSSNQSWTDCVTDQLPVRQQLYQQRLPADRRPAARSRPR